MMAIMFPEILERKRGFTLIELVIVLAIIVIIASLAIPSLLRSRIQTNEAAAIENLRTVSEAEFGYHSAKNIFGDFAALTSEVDGAGTFFLDTSWAEGVERSGYVFSIPANSGADFECFASPRDVGYSGQRYFRIDGSGIIRFSNTGQPAKDDPAIGES